jgi:hypothetical protein
MLDGNKPKFSFKSNKKLITGMVAVAITMLFVFFVYIVIEKENSAQSTVNEVDSAPAAAKIKNTGFDGKNINMNDPAALKAYCEDSISAAKNGDGTKIRDLCVLNEITRKYIPMMTSDELAKMAQNSPTCLETGYDQDGFNCFTGFDQNGCGKNGINEDGKECQVGSSSYRDPSNLLTSTPENICDLVSGCSQEKDFDLDGFNEFGCNRLGRLKSGEMCPYEYITKVYNDKGVDQQGFLKSGFNENGCDVQGVKADGTICLRTEVTRVYNREKLDQFGFFEDGFNKAGCNERGLDKDGIVCSMGDVTLFYDPKTGLDQFGIAVDGFNSNNCNLQGVGRDGLSCEKDEITYIRGADGVDQLGLRPSGYNINNCNLQGQKPDGSACLLSESPRLFSALTGEDQFGFFPNGKNKFGCDEFGKKDNGDFCIESEITRIIGENGRTAFGVDLKGVNIEGCRTDGYDVNNKICDIADIPREFDKTTKRDQFGLDNDGFNDKGCNILGFDKAGVRCSMADIPRIINPVTGRDQFNFGRDGFNTFGCNVDGVKEDGSICDISEISRLFDPKTGLDQFNLNELGYDASTGCNFQGETIAGEKCSYINTPKIINKKGVNQLGYDEHDKNEFGCTPDGKKDNGDLCTAEEQSLGYGVDSFNIKHKDKDGFYRSEFNDFGFNKHNCDMNGRKPDGKLCNIDEITHVYDPLTGKDQFGLGELGFNDYGCSLKGIDASGNECPRELVPRIFDAEFNDQFGVNLSDFDGKTWGANKSILLPLVDESGKPVYIDGELAFVDQKGFVRKKDGTIVLDKNNGQPIRLGADGLVVGTNGKRVLLKDSDNNVITGALVAKGAAPKLRALLSKNGADAYLNGVKAFVNANGDIVDENNNIIKGANGKKYRLNTAGLVVGVDGKEVAMGVFKTASGAAIADGFKVGMAKTTTQIQASVAAGKLTEKLRLSLGIDDDGYNASGCSLLGSRKDGSVCELEDIPRVFDDVTKLDQFGLTNDGFNEYGCNLNGLNRDGAICEPQYTPKIFGADSYDHKGFNGAGYNAGNLNKDGETALGCDTSGEKCSIASTPKYLDAANVDQFNKKTNGTDRLGLTNGFNDKGCNLQGVNYKGELCPIQDVPRLFVGDSDQFGVKRDGFNSLGCNEEGLREDGTICPLADIPRVFDSKLRDRFGLDPQGRNEALCNLQGFMPDGSRCSKGDIPRIYGKDDIDQLGFGKNGLNANKCNIDGLKEDGSHCRFDEITRIVDPKTGLDQFMLDSDGFNEKGCGLDGLNADGKLCEIIDIPRLYNDKLLDQFSINEDGLNSNDCDLYGYDSNGTLCVLSKITRLFDKTKTDQFGVNEKTGTNKNGCDVNGLLKNGDRCKLENTILFVDQNNKDKYSLVDGRNDFGCGIDGLKTDGTICPPEQMPKIILPGDEFDQLGMNKLLRNKNGCGFDGLDSSGKPCGHKDLLRIYDTNDVDQFKVGRNGFNASGCNFMGFNAEGEKCSYRDTPRIIGNDGFDANGFGVDFFSKKGIDPEGFDKSGCDDENKKIDGSFCSSYRKLNLTAADGVYIADKESIMSTWLSSIKGIQDSKTEILATGSYNYDAEKAKDEAALVASAAAYEARQVLEDKTDLSNIDDEAVGSPEQQGDTVQIPAGYVANVFVETPVNSDYTSEVYGKISGGELDGALLIGRPNIPYVDDPVMPRDKLNYEFTKMIYNRQTIPIDAVSINNNNDSGMVDADDVSYHRIQRYGGLILSAGIQALDATFLDSQAEKDLRDQNNAINNAANMALTYGENSRSLTKTNLKTATEYASDLAKQQFNRRPTIMKGVGPQLIIFRTSVVDERAPMVILDLY